MTTLNRLRDLVKRGYRPEWQTEVEGALWLAHPARGERGSKKTCILYEGGLVIAYNNVPMLSTDAEVRVEPEDAHGFQRFLRATPLPTLWEKTADFRYSALAWSVLIGSSLLFSVIIRFAFDVLTALFR